MRIFLIRHGQTRFNIEMREGGTRVHLPLTREGRNQAAALKQRFKSTPFTVIYASPMLRTMQTAEIIAQPHNLCAARAPLFIEVNTGKIEGLTKEEINKIIPDFDEQKSRYGIDLKLPGRSETLRQAQKRAIKALKDLVKTHKENETILVVTHGFILRSIIHYLHGGKPEGVFRTPSPDIAEGVEIEYKNKQFSIKNFIPKHL